MADIFTIYDNKGKKIRLSKERWAHITQEHPQVNDLEEIQQTLKNPTAIRASIYDPKSVKWFYRYNNNKELYLFVAVKYLNGGGFIITSYYARRVK